MLPADFASVEELDKFVAKDQKNTKRTLVAGVLMTAGGLALDLFNRRRGRERTIPLTEFGAMATGYGIAGHLDVREMSGYQQEIHSAIEEGYEPVPGRPSYDIVDRAPAKIEIHVTNLER